MAQIKLNATYGMTGTLPAVSGANLTTLNASNVSSGTLNTDRYVEAVTNTPYFVATVGADHNLTDGSWTQVQFNTETYDPQGCYNNTSGTVTLNSLSVPLYSFMPNVAGYYSCTMMAFMYDGGTDIIDASVRMTLNGSAFCGGTFYDSGNNFGYRSGLCSEVVYFNGSSNYLQAESFVDVGGGTPQILASIYNTFQAFRLNI